MPRPLPVDVNARPIAIDGAGTLGRRIASVFAAGGTDVRIYDVAPGQREAGRAFACEQLEAVRRTLRLEGSRPGQVVACDDLAEAVRDAWMVIEAIPERLDLKVRAFGQLDALAPRDAILASNSSSIPTSQMLAEVSRPERVLNTHYQQPPEQNSVELMSCGETDEDVFDALTEILPRYGLVPFRVRRESDGFIFNRVWAAIKRECLMVVEEGVATPEDVDRMWELFAAAGIPPFRLMDRVGLDVVLHIEEHYASVRPGIPEGPRRLLHRLVDEGRLGDKSGRGFYEHPS